MSLEGGTLGPRLRSRHDRKRKGGLTEVRPLSFFPRAVAPVPPRSSNPFRLVLTSLALAVVLSGCGGGEDAGTGQTTTVSSGATIDRVVNDRR